MRAVRVRFTLFTAILAVAALLLAALPPTPVHGAAGAPGAPGPEGGSASLRDQLDAAARGFNDAAARLDASKARQAQLTEQMSATDAQLTQLTGQVAALAATAYKSGRIAGLAALLDSQSPDSLFQRAASLETRARVEDTRIRQLKETRAVQGVQRTSLDGEIRSQQEQVAEMGRRKQAAEKALAPFGGGQKTLGPAGSPPAASPAPPAAAPANPGATGGAAAAAPVPRRADGTLPPESCSVKDPTTSGCLTPRTAHDLQQAQAAGFNHFVSCYRSQEDGGEHPRGRACDFAAAPRDFGGVATGADRDYGNRLAAWFVANAQRLGVLYVIWFRQIWLPSTGWRAYNNGNGTPSGDHTNHVHLSVQ
jgi:hypothetical protein